MPLSDLLAPAAILPALGAPTKVALFNALAQRASAVTRFSERSILGAITAREALGTTGFGAGVALPHGRLEGLARPVGVFARLVHPIDYAALDDEPVDLAFLLLSPEGDGANHLKALARVSRMFRDRALVARLRGASTADSVLALLAPVPRAHAA